MLDKIGIFELLEMEQTMINADFHIHTKFSTDGRSTPEEVINEAINKGLKTICITDHMDMEWPYDSSEFIFDTNSYFNKLSELREIYKNKLDLRIGMELGLRMEPEVFEKIYPKTKELGKLPFDFIIGSTHIVDNNDPYFDAFWEGHSAHERINDFYETTLFNVKNYQDFDVYGHLDYISRYLPEGCHYEMTRFLPIITEILKLLIESGKGIEVNTKGLYGGSGNLNPEFTILKFYKQLGGEIITVGSDAHDAIKLGERFEAAEAALLAAGFKYRTIFKDRKPEFIPLD
jgi:histidinol-phosphatase (PHP family)